jgi:CHAT domain-containing protein/tetratricopeptide (TPR) repeat protein
MLFNKDRHTHPTPSRAALAWCMLLVVSASPAMAESWSEAFEKADTFYKARQYDSATAACTTSLQLARHEREVSDTVAPLILFKLGNVQFDQSNFDSSQVLLQQAVDLGLSAWPEPGVTFSNFINTLANVYTRLGRYDDALAGHYRTLELRERLLGPDDPLVSSSLNNLSIVYRNMRQYDEAERLLLRALDIRERTFGPTNRRVAGTLQNLGNVASATGRYIEAEQYYRRAVAIKRKTLGPDHPSLASSINGLAISLSQQGRWAEAEPLYHESIGIFEAAFGPDHLALMHPISNLSILYFNLGKFEEAEALDRRALAIGRARLGLEHPDVSDNMANLAHRLWIQGRDDEALGLLRDALTIQEAALGSENLRVAKTHLLLGNVFAGQSAFDSALVHYRTLLTIYRSATTFDRLVLAEVFEGVSYCLAQQGDLDGARAAIDSAVIYLDEVPPLVASRFASVFATKSLVHRARGEYALARQSAHHALLLRQESFAENAMVLSERDALSFSARIRRIGSYYFSALLDDIPDDSTELALGAVAILSTKGQVSDQIYARRRRTQISEDSTLNALVRDYHAVRFQIANRFVTGSALPDQPEELHELDSLGHLADRLEDRLARASAGVLHSNVDDRVDLNAVMDALPSDAALVEFMEIQYRRPNGHVEDPRYIGLVLRPDQSPVIRDLGSTDSVNELIHKYRGHFLDLASRAGAVSSDDLEYYATLAAGLYERIWQPLEPYLSDLGTVFVAPDGGLNLLAFGGLPDSDGQYIIERYAIHYLSAGRDLIRLEQTVAPATGMLAVGDPDFDSPVSSRLSSLPGDGEAALPASDATTVRHINVDCDELLTVDVSPIPGTRSEVELVGSAWSRASAEPALVRTGPGASEETFKRHATSKRVLHLATHGYFLQSICGVEQSEFSQTFLGENPLLLSGLYLAGANLHGSEADTSGADDGVLSAEEVAAMNLQGVGLVVLSACETGLGEVRQGEGVYGLRRAFEMAGARTVVSALWRVPDRETAKFMTRLYTQTTDSYPQMMRQAALDQLAEQRARGRSTHPFFWAGFIATGDWRALR